MREQLAQDGFLKQDVHVPPADTPEFALLLHDARQFCRELCGGNHPAWPVRGVRWLNRISIAAVGKLFAELPPSQRRAIAHAAITLAGQPHLLA